MTENLRGISFVMCGSGMRRIKHSGANLLGGRAWRQNFMPLCYPELPYFDLLGVFNRGLIPDRFLSDGDPTRMLKSYVSEYLVPEIQWESRLRNFGAFGRFLEAMAFSNGEMINCSNISRECAVDAKSVRAYADLLQEMMIGYLVFPYAKSESGVVISRMPKFYFFDPAIANSLMNRTVSQLKGAEAGHCLEHYVFLELLAYREINHKYYKINYWRTKTGLEVDFIPDGGKTAVEVKISESVHRADLSGLIAFTKEHRPQKSIVASLDRHRRAINVDDLKIDVYPIKDFLNELWSGGIV
jgi:predicted AAA+ superfamily ATPase